MKLHVTFRLAYLHLTLVNANGHSQGHQHFDSEYLTNAEDRTIITNTNKYRDAYGL